MSCNALSWRDYSLQAKTKVAVLGPMLALLLSCIFVSWRSAQEADAQRWVAHTFEVRFHLKRLERTFGAIHVALNNHPSDGSHDMQLAAKRSLAESREALSNVQPLTSDNPVQVRRASELQSLLGTYTRLFDGAGAQSRASVTKENALAKQISDKIQAIDKTEAQLLDLRAARAAELRSISSLVIAGTILIGVMGGLLATSLLSKNICHRISQLLESFDVVANGLPVKSVDKSRDELGRLASSLAQTSQVLSERANEIAELTWTLQSVLRAATEVAIIAESMEGRITIFNTGATKLLGYRADEATGRSLITMLHGDSTLGGEDDAFRELKLARSSALQNVPREYETIYVRKDGLRLQMQVSIAPLKNVSGKVVGLLHVAQDVTPRKLLEGELRKKMKVLRLRNQRADELGDKHLDMFAMLENQTTEPLKRVHKVLTFLGESRLEEHMLRIVGECCTDVERILEAFRQLREMNPAELADHPEQLDTNILPEMLKPAQSRDGERLSSALGSINNWYEQNGQIPNPNESAGGQFPKILIVDDFEATRFLLRAYLQGEGYELHFASNGEEALEKIRKHLYSLILMDVEMPAMGGYETASRIRTWEQTEGRSPISIVALSAHEEAESNTPKKAVWTSYLLKPLSKSQLLSEVKSHVKPSIPVNV